MRKIAAFLLGALLGAGAWANSAVYVANAEDGDIGIYSLDAGSGALTPRGKAEAGKLVMGLAVNPKRQVLYALVRSQPYRVISYAIDRKSGALARKAEAPLPENMVYISTDRSGRFLFSASYAADKVAVSAIGADGLITAAPHQVLPTGRNAHCVRADGSNRFVFVTNLGDGQILQYRFDGTTGLLSENAPAQIKVPAGNGPRHGVFSPDNRFFYVLHELTGTVGQFALDAAKGTLSEVGYVGGVPAETGLQPGVARAPVAAGAPPPAPDPVARIWAADLHMTPDGRFLYASERTGSSIALLRVGKGDGRLSYVGNFATETQPRGFAIDPSGRYLVAGGEKSDRLSLFRIDPKDGRLWLTGRVESGKGANWVEIVELK
jgi:6-phosphogluconolactonase